jgi:glycosyltransferase involved in cell wall biosynthesis
MSLKIIMIHSGELNLSTGGGIHTFELFNLLSIKNKVICFASGSSENCNLTNIRYVPHVNIPGIRSLSYDLFLAVYLIYYCLFFKPDVIYVRKPGLIFSPALIAKFFGIIYIIEMNGLYKEDMLALHHNGVCTRLSNLIERLNYSLTDFFIAVTPEIKKGLSLYYGIPETKIEIIENGVNSSKFKIINRNEAIKLSGLKLSCRYVCFVGGLAPWHGVEYLIEASSLILNEVPDTRILIIGDGPMKYILREQVNNLGLSDYVIFTGNVPHEKIPFYINSSDICVAPFTVGRNTKTGLSPLKIYEYLACGKPVIASDLPGVRDIINKSHGGWLVEPQNARALGKAIVQILTYGNTHVAKPEELSKYIEDHYSWDLVAKKTEEIFNKMIR